MKLKTFSPKPLHEQVVVVTGASSGIGLATAYLAAERGARVALISRNEDDLAQIVRKIEVAGGQAMYAVADVSNFDELKEAARSILSSFGRIDTWVNNAGSGGYGYVFDQPLVELRKAMDVNFWGVHYGCMIALDAMKKTGGGMIINLGSELSERGIGIQTMYSASKAAIKGYTEGLRAELEREGFPIGLTLVRPASMNTPYMDHAPNHLREGEPSLPWPQYDPRIAADAILTCAETGKRDVYIGFASKFGAIGSQLAPKLVDRLVQWYFMDSETQGGRTPHLKQTEGLLHAPPTEGKIDGNSKQHVFKRSLYTQATLHPFQTLAITTGLATIAATAAWLASPRNRVIE